MLAARFAEPFPPSQRIAHRIELPGRRRTDFKDILREATDTGAFIEPPSPVADIPDIQRRRSVRIDILLR